MNKIFLLLFSVFIYSGLYAQSDKEFWFSVPAVNVGTQDYNKPIALRITSFNEPSIVTISIPANPSFVPLIRNISANSTITVDLTQWIGLLENLPANTILNNGLLIQSTENIAAYYEVVSSYCHCNPEIFSLKGKNALGNEFYISSQNIYNNDIERFSGPNSSFDIVATENNTKIFITPSRNILGHLEGITFSINLNKGQTYSAVAESAIGTNHLLGSHITSDKPIAITLKDDLLRFEFSSDLAGDQTVPVSVLGNEYILTKGYLMYYDNIYVMATEDNTTIYRDGNPVPIKVLNKGQSYQLMLQANSTYITSDKNIYVYQVTGNGFEIGSAIVPKLNCTGSNTVSVVRSNRELFALMIATKKEHQENFMINGSSGFITAADFTPVPGTNGNYVSARIDLSDLTQFPLNETLNISNSTGRFSLGYINGSPNNGCRFAYFSDFKTSNVHNGYMETCPGESVQLSAFGGKSYSWLPAEGLSNSRISSPIATPRVTTNYTVTITGADACIDYATTTVAVLPAPTIDFSFEQELCNPASVLFRTESENFKQFEWNFGNGAVLTNIQEPQVTYDQWADYPVKLKATTEDGCADSVIKTVAIGLTIDEVTTSSDTAFCWSDSPFQLNTLPGLKYCWTPARGLSDPSIANPVISSVIPATTYYVNSMQVGRNLVTNGDFSAGNTGFVSDYNYRTQKLLPGEYLIDITPEKGNMALADCKDHTTGNGKMMVIDGASVPDVKVWKQTIPIKPHTNYAFSCWLQSIYQENPAKLQFYINGILIGSIFNASATPANWQQFYSVWNAGDTTKAEIAIVNQNAYSSGNDFALDDISFGELIIARDSVTVAIHPNPEIDFTYNIPFCKSPQFTGIAINTPFPMASWSWDFGDGETSASTVLTHTYLKGGEYDIKLLAADQNGCKDSAIKTIQLDTVKAVVNADTTVCINSAFSLQGSGGILYEWSPATFLDDPTSPEPEGRVSENTRFFLTVKNGIGCENTDSVLVSVKPRPEFVKPSDWTVCRDSILQLAGGNGTMHEYRWAPAELLDDATAMDPVTIPPASMQYQLTVTEVPCGYDTTFNIRVTVNPNPVAIAWKQGDIDCLNPTVYLGAGSSPGIVRFEWAPASGVDNPFSTKPLASADTTTTFVLKATNSFGCAAYDSVIVEVTNTAQPFFTLPNAFTPNGDGINDLFSIKRWGNVTIHEFTIFNRWGQRVFSTKNPKDGWDGRYQGKLQPGGTYGYTIRATSFCGELVKRGTLQLVR